MSSIHRSGSLSDHAAIIGPAGRGRRRPRPNRRRPPKVPGRWLFRALRAAKVTAALALLAGAAFGVREGWQRARSSPELAVAALDVSGNRRATTEALAHYAGVQLGDSMLALDVEAVARGVRAHPWVASAEVTRVLPRTVRIEVVEHEPVVLVALDNLYYANARGDVVKRYAPGEREALPVVTGLTREEVEAADPAARRRLLEAIGFVAEYRGVVGASAPALAEVHLDRTLGLSFAVEGSPTRVLLGWAPFADRLARAREVERALGASGLEATRITAVTGRRKDRVVARLAAQGDGGAAAQVVGARAGAAAPEDL